MFRVCDSKTGEVLLVTETIQELSDYLVAHETKFITVQPNLEELAKCLK
jgi:hypothetical protein